MLSYWYKEERDRGTEMIEMAEREMTTEERERVLVAGTVAMIQTALAEGHDLMDLLDLIEGEARTVVIEELARLEMI